MIKLPQDTYFTQNNYSDRFGDLYSSWNVNLKEPGKLKTTRMLSVANSTDVSGLGLAGAFIYYDYNGSSGQYFAATTGTISKCGTSRTSPWALDTNSGKPTTCHNRYSDIEIFLNTLCVTVSGTDLYKWNGSAWSTTAITGAQSNVPHLQLQYADRLYVTVDYAKINSTADLSSWKTTVGTDPNTLDLGNPYENTITKLLKTSSRIWILTVNRNGNYGKVFAWDGEATSVSESYELDSSGAWSGVVINDTPYILSVDGKLLAFNGGSFVEIDRLPLKIGEYLHYALGAYNERPVQANGMDVLEGEILINFNNLYRNSSSEVEERIGSGIIAWNKETGFYHKFSFSYLDDEGTTILDYGQNRISLSGAIYAIKSTSNAAADNGSILASAQLYTDSGSTTVKYILIDDFNDTKGKFAYFITPKIFSQNLKDTWQKLSIRLKKLTTSGDYISLWYRQHDEDPLEITITAWANSSAVNTTTNISDYDVGDSIEFLQGQGSGKIFKISSITDLGGGTTQIGLDSEFASVGGSGKARLQHWKQVGSKFTSLTKDIYEQMLLNISNSAWVQFLVCIQNTGNSYIYDLNLENKEE